MRVLWVEDFGGDSDAESFLDEVFSELVSSQRLDALVETQERGNEKSRPHGYDGWRTWYEKQPITNHPEIDIYRKAGDFDELLKSGFLVDRYDAVLLDINLENNFFSGNLAYPAAEGGFWLYNKLVRAGFPSERIALLTAHNLERPTTEFVAACERYGHEALRAFGKMNAEAGQWIGKLAIDNGGFLTMRRGVLDGVVFVEESLGIHGDKAIRFNCFVGEDQLLTFEQAKDYLDTTRHLLPVRVNGAQIESQLRGFRYLLACEWDRANPRSVDDGIYQALGRVMKRLRNWSSHGHLLDSASVGDIAFLAFVGLRAGFSDPGGSDLELRRYEHRLLGAVNAELDIVDLPRRLARSYFEAKRLLIRLVGEPSTIKRNETWVLQDQLMFDGIVNELAIAVATPQGFDFPVALREMLVLSVISPRGPSVDGGNADNLKVIEADFEKRLSNIWDQLPNWFKAASTRI